MRGTGDTQLAATVRDKLARLSELNQFYEQALTAADRQEAMRNSVACLLNDGVFDIAWVGHKVQDDSLTIGIAEGTRTDVLHELPIPPATGLTGKVFQHGTLDWVDDYFAAGTISHDFDQQIRAEHVQRLIAVPVTTHDGVLGVLSAGARTSGSFGDRAIERIVATANSASVAASAAERARHEAEAAAQEERRRVAVELHDTVGALLYAIGTGVRDLHAALDPSELSGRLKILEDQAAEASYLLRDSLRTLHASTTDLALSSAVKADCRNFEQRSGLRAELVTLGELPSLAPDRIQLITRAVREALLNVEKHAQANSVVVTLSAEHGELTVVVTDDGIGIDPHHFGGIGLASIADSLADIGGTLEVRPAPDTGTRWRARLPL